MGLLSLGTPMPWDEAKKHADHVRKHGIVQFSNIWRRIKSRRRDHLLWGDEVEYIVVHLDAKTQTARVSLGANEALQKLEAMEKAAIDAGKVFESSWKPEYGRYMLEGTPGAPYGSTLQDLLSVEPNMVQRRKLAQSVLKPNEAVVTLTNFPRLGCPDFVFPSNAARPDAENGSSRSLFISDEAINPHPRFRTLTANIRKRRGSKVAINMPIFKDTNTPSPFREPAPEVLKQPETNLKEALTPGGLPEEQTANLNKSALPSLPDLAPGAKEDHIYMDCMCFGMGCCCLQVTFQACSVEEARRLYDNLAVLSPVMMALSAAAPIFRGYLADVDCRWNVISGSVDDRTDEERGLQPLKLSRFNIPKSRYDSISTYLSSGPNYSGGCGTIPGTDEIICHYKPEYNDINLVHDKDIYNELRNQGVDDILAKHYAHLFIRDPLVIFSELLNVDDATSSDHFENIQSTNWQTMRFKPPPPTANIGWRVEFRSMEIQLTDYENAAYSVFVVDENMKTGMKRDAAINEKFWFRNHVSAPSSPIEQSDDSFALMSSDEIMNGNDSFRGLIPLVRAYLTSASIPYSTFTVLDGYLNLISKRASGELPTAARWMRNFVTSHSEYKHDSVVNNKINWDLVQEVIKLGNTEGPLGVCQQHIIPNTQAKMHLRSQTHCLPWRHSTKYALALLTILTAALVECSPTPTATTSTRTSLVRNLTPSPRFKNCQVNVTTPPIAATSRVLAILLPAGAVTTYDDLMTEFSFGSELPEKGYLFSNMHAVSENPILNTIELIAGGEKGYLLDLLEASNKTWKAYLEDFVPVDCNITSSTPSDDSEEFDFPTLVTTPSRCASISDAENWDADVDSGNLPDFSVYIPSFDLSIVDNSDRDSGDNGEADGSDPTAPLEGAFSGIFGDVDGLNFTNDDGADVATAPFSVPLIQVSTWITDFLSGNLERLNNTLIVITFDRPNPNITSPIYTLLIPSTNASISLLPQTVDSTYYTMRNLTSTIASILVPSSSGLGNPIPLAGYASCFKEQRRKTSTTAAPFQLGGVGFARPSPTPSFVDFVEPPENSSTTSCAHRICETGTALDPQCDPCVDRIIKSVPSCSKVWDVKCLNGAFDQCGITC
ncbi:hypothetical protein HDU97_002117 [Phlyctochytrium planicorne]|nr:hypothetical protein HDU97_002117 [Phlyctochytrium planicorne]